MAEALHNWLLFLRDADALVGIPLIVAGAGLMLFGWRMWKACVVTSFALIGAGVALLLADGSDYSPILALVCGAIAGLVVYRPAKYAVALLGGGMGAGFIVYLLGGSGLYGTPLWLTGFAAFIGFSAYSFINRRLVVIFITAAIGASLAISGLTAFVMESRALYGNMAAMASGSIIVVPFMLLVPTVMSCFYQSAEARRLHADL